MDIDQAIKEAEELLLQAKTAEIKDALRKSYYELLKRKYSESKELKENDGHDEHLPLQKLPKVMEKITKLHALRKFKIDEDIIRELYRNHKGRVHEFFMSLAKYLPKYFENNKEMLEYIRNKSYVGLRVKVIYSKNHEDQMDEYFVPHNHKRRYLAQSLSDLSDIMIDQMPIIEEQITEFIRNGSGYVVTGIKSVKLEVTRLNQVFEELVDMFRFIHGYREEEVLSILETKIISAFGNAYIVLFTQIQGDMIIENIPEIFRQQSYNNLWTVMVLIRVSSNMVIRSRVEGLMHFGATQSFFAPRHFLSQILPRASGHYFETLLFMPFGLSTF
jgi:hypothetical protein